MHKPRAAGPRRRRARRVLMPGALTPKAAGLRHAEEAARGALLAAHAAAGLAAGHSPAGVRLLRAAEGLLRAAVAGLRSPAAEPPPPAPGAAPAPLRRRRRRGRGGRGGDAAGRAGAAAMGARPDDGVEAVDLEREGGAGSGRRPRRRGCPEPAPAGLPLERVTARPAADVDESDELDDAWADGGRPARPGRGGAGAAAEARDGAGSGRAAHLGAPDGRGGGAGSRSWRSGCCGAGGGLCVGRPSTRSRRGGGQLSPLMSCGGRAVVCEWHRLPWALRGCAALSGFLSA
ncbi:unnamed protein product [Prorocentrum cordatum]|uniref:Uncharacterized protein n=1 Tax=Prorocentrum cordatum TaxID=2364126 RepID=A0ABN9X6C8_9DINO|nr:unnamed protein product [Polarella glacialis]